MRGRAGGRGHGVSRGVPACGVGPLRTGRSLPVCLCHGSWSGALRREPCKRVSFVERGVIPDLTVAAGAGREQGSLRESARESWSDPRNAFRKMAPTKLRSPRGMSAGQHGGRLLQGGALHPLVGSGARSCRDCFAELHVSITLRLHLSEAGRGPLTPTARLLAQLPAHTAKPWPGLLVLGTGPRFLRAAPAGGRSVLISPRA